jgi:AAA family ATP:ADP antiporter
VVDAGVLHGLLRDTDVRVAGAACKTAAQTQSRAHLEGLVRMLPNARYRQHALDALACYGDRIVGTLGDLLLDSTVPAAVRRQVPRVLRRIPTQRSVDVLISALKEPDLTVRTQALKALNSLRESDSKLNFGRESVMQYIHEEARYYYATSAALQPFRDNTETPAARLLAKTLEERLRSALERLFRLLGLRYPPKEIHAAYLAMNRKSGDQYSAAIEFLDNVLDARAAIRELIRSGDSWLVACAVATAAELGLHDLRPDIEPLAHKSGSDVAPVAQQALARLAA